MPITKQVCQLFYALAFRNCNVNLFLLKFTHGFKYRTAGCYIYTIWYIYSNSQVIHQYGRKL